MTMRRPLVLQDEIHDCENDRPSFWKRKVPGNVAAGWLAGAVLVTAAGIELTRAWGQAAEARTEAAQIVGGLLVAILVLGALTLATRTRELALVVPVGVFGLLAHGSTLVLDGEVIGAMFLGIAPVLAVLSRATFRRGSSAPPPPSHRRARSATFIRANVQNA